MYKLVLSTLVEYDSEIDIADGDNIMLGNESHGTYEDEFCKAANIITSEFRGLSHTDTHLRPGIQAMM